MRLFVALPLTSAARRSLSDQLGDSGHPEWRWTAAGTWHVTLAFLGEVEEDRLGAVAGAIAAAAGRAAGPVRLTVEALRTVGRRMVWLDLVDEPAGAVAELGADLQEAVAEAGLPVDPKPVTPHVTVARWRGGGRRASRSAEPALPSVTLEWTVTEAVLYRSHLGGDGATHEALLAESLG